MDKIGYAEAHENHFRLYHWIHANIFFGTVQALDKVNDNPRILKAIIGFAAKQ